jgi:RNA polymerase sigma-70 factor (ECF subfamily)
VAHERTRPIFREKREQLAEPFEDFYRAHFRFVWRALGSMGVRKVDLMDLTQNVFIIVHRQLASFEGRSKVTTWLFTICRLVTRDYQRSAPIRREVVFDARELARRAGTCDGLSQQLNAQDLSHLLELILSRMPEKLRVVFVMFELEELSGDEIARALNVPVGTVRSRLRLAREAVQQSVKVLRKPDDEAPLGADLNRAGGHEDLPPAVRMLA